MALALTSVTDPVVAGQSATIVCAGAGASQGAGYVLIGELGKKCQVVSWSATEIVVKVPVSIATEDYTLIVVNDAMEMGSLDGWSITASQTGANSGEVLMPMIATVTIDGVDVGYVEDQVRITPTKETVDWKPAQQRTILKTFVISNEVKISFTFSQVNAQSFGMAFSGELDFGNYANTVYSQFPVDNTVVDHEMIIEDTLGNSWLFPRVQLIEPGEIALNRDEVQTIPVTFRALAVNDSGYAARLILA